MHFDCQGLSTFAAVALRLLSEPRKQCEHGFLTVPVPKNEALCPTSRLAMNRAKAKDLNVRLLPTDPCS